jgi:hypothetical protein
MFLHPNQLTCDTELRLSSVSSALATPILRRSEDLRTDTVSQWSTMPNNTIWACIVVIYAKCECDHLCLRATKLTHRHLSILKLATHIVRRV